MYKSLTDLDLTPSQRETLDFLIKQAGRYEKIRSFDYSDHKVLMDMIIESEINDGFDLDRYIDAL